MKKLLLTCLCLFGTLAPLCSQTVVEHTVLFKTGEYSLEPSARATLDALLAQQDSCPIRRIAIQGHTDAIGDEEDNLKLSQQRTLAVARYLRSQGINPKRVKIKAHSENRPVASNDTYSGRKQNRRVEVKVLYGPAFDGGLDDDSGLAGTCGQNEVEEEDLSGVPMNLRSNIGFYECDRPLEMTGRKGATVSLPENAFENCGDKPVEVRVQEFHRIEDVAGYEVSTMAGDILLESAGMICISAFLEQNQLQQIREGQVLQVRIPASKFDPEMGLYYAGNRGNRSEMDWSRMAGEAPWYEDSTKSYVFNVSNLGCINLDKPAPMDAERIPLAVKVRKRLVRSPHLYCNYRDRGTMSQGVLKDQRYITFGGAKIGEKVRLKGRLSSKRNTLKIDKNMVVDTTKAKIIEIEGQEYRLIANVTARGINKRDRFRRRNGHAYYRFGQEMSYQEQ